MIKNFIKVVPPNCLAANQQTEYPEEKEKQRASNILLQNLLWSEVYPHGLYKSMDFSRPEYWSG